MLTAETARATWSYDPETGLLRWKISPAKHIKIGCIAGYCQKFKTTTYVILRFKNKNYRAHRVIWMILHGVWPSEDVDHVNGVGVDNKIKNLRDVSQLENLKNQRLRKTNKSGFCGVCWLKHISKWRARINFNSSTVTLGYFVNIEDAIAARQAANVQHGFHPLHGTNKES